MTNKIPKEQILKDIKDTQEEIDDLRAEKAILGKNPVQNRMLIYIKQGHILQREEFIEELKRLLEKEND